MDADGTTYDAADLAKFTEILNIYGQKFSWTKDGDAVLKGRKIPRVPLFHLRYDVDGQIVDWHSDTFRGDANALIRKLSVVYPENNKPVWVLQVPEGAQKPIGKLRCRVSTCPAGPFITESDLELHMSRHHPETISAEERQKAADTANKQNAMFEMLINMMAEKMGMNTAEIAATVERKFRRRDGTNGG